ncbi:GNAT family N-acetyltransferase [Devosia sediminis]|uniref:GNAT family N-acetyltransferase n=1 Tax=Devosia sediminis TaxID=2798801 RepID=A0A934ITE8_9HYPH|nr:GNAT family N-acetyltransferase [Devosia sediminis]MBJ3783997.1 GNAT family N-acetyltransferase [Devosia sediminis]
MNAHSQFAARAVEQIRAEVSAPVAAPISAPYDFAVTVFHDIAAVESIWRRFTAAGIESPGQSFDFIRLWVEDRRIRSADQHYVLGTVNGEPVAILPLHRKRVHGVRVFTWFPGAHAGCYAPVADIAQLAALGPQGRAQLWRAMAGALKGADLAYLRSVPASLGVHGNLFDELGSHLSVETLFRAQFSSWEQCDSEQRSRSRRKHDRQQGDRLAALGEVAFEEVTEPVAAHTAVDIMFAQRSARFRSQGIRDAFVADHLMGFYHAALDAGSGVNVRLHVLRLDGAIVAVRYNVVHGDRMFCLISSMSDCERVQSGSPGKQCLLRVMQTVFDEGFAIFDMGSGFTDEKRHWCNVQVPLRQHYLSLSLVGALIVAGHQSYQRLRAWAKGNDRIKALRRMTRLAIERVTGARTSDQL